ncbi:hypothetical protein [Streptomyces sp. NPDC002386]
MSARTTIAHALRVYYADSPNLQRLVDGLLGKLRNEHRVEVLGTDLNPSRLVVDARSYRQLADDVLATMTDPDRWDLDADEGSICSQYVQHLAAQLTLASEFRVPLPDGLGGYGEIVVQRESTGSDRWAVTDGAVTGLRAWLYPAGWQYVSDVGRDVAFVHDLDDALELAEAVAKIERDAFDARIRAHREKSSRAAADATHEPAQAGGDQ